MKEELENMSSVLWILVLNFFSTWICVDAQVRKLGVLFFTPAEFICMHPNNPTLSAHAYADYH